MTDTQDTSALADTVTLEQLTRERDTFRAVLEGQGFNELDKLGTLGAEGGRKIGEQAQANATQLIHERTLLADAMTAFMVRCGIVSPDVPVEGAMMLMIFEQAADDYERINEQAKHCETFVDLADKLAGLAADLSPIHKRPNESKRKVLIGRVNTLVPRTALAIAAHRAEELSKPETIQ